MSTTPAASCTPPQTLVDGICATPPPTACDDRANTALCVNQRHQTGGLGSEESADAKADIYKATCARSAVGVRASISGLTAENSARVSIQASKGGVEAPVIVDLTPGDGIVSGRSAKLTKGPGVYRVKIKKEKSKILGIVQYDATISCLAKTGVKVGGKIVIKKNQ